MMMNDEQGEMSHSDGRWVSARPRHNPPATRVIHFHYPFSDFSCQSEDVIHCASAAV